jgi:hypothetical protein
VVLQQGNVIGLGDPIHQLLVLGNNIFEKEESECPGIAGAIYGMNEALGCSPNYPHTRLSTITRSHVRDSDFRLITKEVKEFDTTIDVRVFERSVESSVGREQKEARARLALLERRQLRPKKSTVVRKSLHKAVDWLRLDFRFVAKQISAASEASPGVSEPTLSVRPSQRGYRLVAKKRVLWVLRFN